MSRIADFRGTSDVRYDCDPNAVMHSAPESHIMKIAQATPLYETVPPDCMAGQSVWSPI